MHRRHRFLIALSRLTAAALGLAVLASVPQPTAARPVQQRVVREALFQPIDHFGGAITGVAVEGHLAYIDRGLRLEVLDITDPLAPRTIGRSALLPELARVAAVSDGQVYLVKRVPTNSDVPAGRLYIVDVTDPAAPRLRGRLDLGANYLLQVAVRDGLLYGAGAKSGLLVLDVRDPDRPRYLTAVGTDLAVTGLAVDGVRLLVSVGWDARSGGLLVFGLADPTLPTLMGKLDVGQDARAVAPVGRYALLATLENLFVVDLADPAAPRVASQVRAYEGVDIVVSGTRAWLRRRWVAPRDTNHLALFDLADLPVIRPLGELSMLTNRGMAAAGDLVLAADGARGLLVVGPAEPGEKRLRLRHREPTIGSPAGVVIDGDHAFISDEDGEVWVLDLRDPASPAVVGRVDLQNEGTLLSMEGTRGTAALAVRDGRAYVARTGWNWTIGGLHVVDVSNPAAPRQVGRWDAYTELERHPELETKSVMPNGYPPVLSGDRLWFTGLPLLTELDISDPTAPRYVRMADHRYPSNQGPSFPQPGSVVVADGRAWVAEPVTGLHLLDVTAGGDFSPIARSSTSGSPSDVMVAGAYTLVADRWGGLLAVDARSLTPVRSLPEVPAERLVRAGGTVIVAGYLDGVSDDRRLRLSAVDIADPSLPVLRGTYDLPGNGSWSSPPADIAVVGDLLYVTAGAAGIAILRLTDGAALPLPTVGPTLTPLPTDDPTQPTATDEPVQPLPSSTPAPPGATATVVARPTVTAEGSGSGAPRTLWLPLVWR
ncbi:MAG: hypothetical protein IPJ58_11440 [Ardenticatenia bacterium]|nr:hypothetical protein [Ardenticatenia bacterium]